MRVSQSTFEQRFPCLQEAPVGGLVEACVCSVEISCLNIVHDRHPSISGIKNTWEWEPTEVGRSPLALPFVPSRPGIPPAMVQMFGPRLTKSV